jgi:hypothetical protein
MRKTAGSALVLAAAVSGAGQSTSECSAICAGARSLFPWQIRSNSTALKTLGVFKDKSSGTGLDDPQIALDDLYGPAAHRNLIPFSGSGHLLPRDSN